MVAEPGAELADATRSQPKSLGHDIGLLTERECPRDPPIPRRETAKPIRHIQARCRRFGRPRPPIFA